MICGSRPHYLSRKQKTSRLIWSILLSRSGIATRRSPVRCWAQRPGQRWRCPPSLRSGEIPSYPSRSSWPTGAPQYSPSRSRSGSPWAAGSCMPSSQWRWRYAWGSSLSGHHRQSESKQLVNFLHYKLANWNMFLDDEIASSVKLTETYYELHSFSKIIRSVNSKSSHSNLIL